MRVGNAEVRSEGAVLDEAAERVWWVHGEVANKGTLPLAEVERIVDPLEAALDDRGPPSALARALAPADGYTTSHAISVALLVMTLARHLAYDDEELRLVGTAALLHDLGKVRLPLSETPAEGLTAELRAALERHPAEGARVLLSAGERHAVSAIVAYEHHLPAAGDGGYPARHYPRPPHRFSRLVRVCDTYDVLRRPRPYRPRLSHDAALRYLEIQAGGTLDPELITAFAGMCGDRVPPRVADDAPGPELGITELARMPDGPFDPDTETGTAVL
ncbi:MAG: HD-GYP domain-containing protein [Gemmatimonadota bacterium]